MVVAALDMPMVHWAIRADNPGRVRRPWAAVSAGSRYPARFEVDHDDMQAAVTMVDVCVAVCQVGVAVGVEVAHSKKTSS